MGDTHTTVSPLRHSVCAVHTEARDAPTRLLTPAFVRLLVIQGAFGMSFSVFFLLPKFLAEVGTTASQIGLVMATWGVAGLLVAPLVGSGSDRHGRRPFLLAGVAAMALAAFGFAFVEGFGALALGLRFVQGAAFAFVYNTVITMVADAAPARRLGQAVGLAGLAGLITNALAPALAEPFADTFGWPAAFGGAAALALVALALAWRVSEPSRPLATEGTGWSALWARREVRLWAAAVAACGVGFGTLTTFHQPFALALGFTHVSAFFVAYTIAATVVRLGFGGLADRVGPRSVSVVSLGAYAVVVAAASALDVLGLWVIGGGLGAAHGAFFPAISALSMQGGSPAQRGRVVSVVYMAFNAGLAASMLGLGPVAERWGYEPLFLIAAAIVAVGAKALHAAPRGP
jgi:MFS family permease